MSTSAKPGAHRGGGSGRGRQGLGRRILKGLLVTGLLGTATGIAVFLFVYASTDVPNPNRDFQTQTTYVYFAGGNREIGRFAEQNRESVALSTVPQHVQDAVIAAEDRSFYTNRGIDPKGILRAAFSNASGNSTQGASTITQQYVKVLYLSQERTLTRKAKEAFVSLKIQQQMSKREILQGYLNTIYFGRGAYGIEAAAQAFFAKPAAELSVAEGAALAAILNSPGNLDPQGAEGNEEALQQRYDYVIRSMTETETLDASTAAQLRGNLPDFPEIDARDANGGQRGFVLDLVRRELLAEGFSEQEIEGGGLRVRTSLTRPAMRAARQGMRAARPPGFPARDLHVAVASVQPGTGALRGFYAGQGYLVSQINWALTGSSPGSTFKAFAVAAALRNGYGLQDGFDGNSPLELADGSDVENQGNESFGSSVSLLTATENSINTAFVDLTLDMPDGPQQILRTATRLGIPRDAPGLEPNTGIALGSATISPVAMANAYGAIAARGRYAPVHVLEEVSDANGRELWKQFDESRRVLPRGVADDTSYALQQVVEQGTGQTVQSIGRPAAGKTGTATDGNGNVSSSWFVGYTPQLATAVMYARGDGNDPLDGYLPSFFGSVYPAQTWAAVMSRALEGRQARDFPPPANLDGRARTPEPSPTPSPTPPPVPSPTPTPTPSPTPSPTPTPTPTPSPTPTPTPTPTPVPTPSPTPTPTPTPAPTPAPAPSQDEADVLGRVPGGDRDGAGSDDGPATDGDQPGADGG